ncbi:MAG: helix-turn-helix transcriptional regulator [Gemmatimonadetes bacterium]|nr:helix-turn-helix transcriptional regulator [Gemmatimonadota bacterium]
MARAALGEFEHHVLLAVLRLGGRSYSAPVVMELESTTGRAVSPAAVFVALRRLEQRGYLRSSKRAPKPGEGGRGRREFAVTPAAVVKLRESRRAFERLWRGLDPLTERP